MLKKELRVFHTTNWFTPVTSIIEVLIIGGGGGGGYGGCPGLSMYNGQHTDDLRGGDGGGAGQAIYLNDYKVKPGVPIKIVIGCGGTGGSLLSVATCGQRSCFGDLTADGGPCGESLQRLTGGSGGNGLNGKGLNSSDTNGANGGEAKTYFKNSFILGGGGGGGARNGIGGSGGSELGGAGGNTPDGNGGNGAVNTGSGGGGGAYNGNGGNGGSGIIVLSWNVLPVTYQPPDQSLTVAQNLTVDVIYTNNNQAIFGA